jgi:hypothetical protein
VPIIPGQDSEAESREYEFKASLGYRGSLKPAMAVSQDPVSKIDTYIHTYIYNR